MRHQTTLTCAALLMSVISVAVRADEPISKPDLSAASHRVAAVATDAGLAGEIVLTDQTGAAKDLAFGLADRTNAKPHQVGQRWLWASVTKQVVAVLVMQEVERGRLALDDAIGDHLPAFGGDRSTTVRELLQHRSGLPNPSDGGRDGEVRPFYRETGRLIGDTARTKGFCSGPAKGPKGGDFEYNNCDYLVLGALLEHVTGKAFDKLVAERIAGPLGLRTVRVARDQQPRGGAAAIGYDGQERYPDLNVATFGAAGALTGSAADLAAIDRALMDGRLLSSASRAEAWKGDPKLGYEALGVWSFPAKLAGCPGPVALIERRGDVGGTQVRNVIAPGLGRAIVVFTNDAALDFGEVWQGKGLSHDLLAAAFCAPASDAAAAELMPSADVPTKAVLVGSWTVDLRPTPTSPAYLKPMVLAVSGDGAMTGEFYEHAIEDGRAGATNRRPCFAFRTSDVSGPYQTSGCLVGDRIEGQTWSEGRNFVLTWTAVQAAAAAD